MIKTHKPRGQQWTHASEFQQSTEFRNINLDECEATSESDIQAKGSERKTTSSARVAQRQRIEKLANDFLDGTPLFISSARPPPQSLKSTVFRNTKDYGQPAHPLPSASECHPGSASIAQHEEVEDENEILERLTNRLRRNLPPLHTTDRTSVVSVTSQTLQAQAKYRPIRRSRAINVTTDPSVEALQQAAALRTRKSKRSNSEISALHRQALNKTLVAGTSPEPRTAPAAGSRRAFHTNSSGRWLSRRRSRFSFSKYMPDDDSLDELRLSPDDQQKASLIEPSTNLSGLTEEHPHTDSSHDKASYRTAQEQNATDPGSNDIGQSDWTDAESSKRNESDTPSLSHLTAGTAVDLVHHQSPPSRRTRSRTAKPHTQSDSRPPSGYITAHSSQATSTPFMFRKRHSDTHDHASDPELTSDSRANHDMRRRSRPLREPISVDNAQLATARVAESDSIEAIRTSASSNRDVLSADAPQLQSTDDAQEASRHGSSCDGENNVAIQDVSPTAASCETLLASPTLAPVDTVEASDSMMRGAHSDSPAWAGTQFLLNKAQQDLFTSPEKQATVLANHGQQTPQQNEDMPRVRASSSRREPLAQLSQEPLPSTQQLLGDFEGWSTVKKPRVGIRASLLPTPSVKGIASPLDKTPTTTRASSSAPATKHTAGKVIRAETHLRHSLSSTAPSTVEPLANVAASATVRQGSYESHTLVPSGGTGTGEPWVSSTIPPVGERDMSTVQDVTTSSELSAVLLTSFEMAQKSPQLLREQTDLSQTIDDLRNMLDTSDMQGVLSQVD